MGQYIPARPKKRRSVADALKEAERDHFIDCPDADFLTRSAALVLDVVLFSVASSGIQQFGFAHYAAVSSVAQILGTSLPQNFFLELVAGATILFKISAFYLIFVWSITHYRGTPGKLLLGLRLVETESGHALGPTRAILREAICKPISLLTGVGVFVSLFRKDHRSVHDLICGSSVKQIVQRGKKR